MERNGADGNGRKRKPSDGEDFLTLSLSPPEEEPRAPPSRSREGERRNKARKAAADKDPTIEAEFPWSGTARATVRSLSFLLDHNITAITGEVQCKRCEKAYVMEFDLVRKFSELSAYICQNKAEMRQRAPKIWQTPALPSCRFCKEANSVRPVIAPKKRLINWLFLLLGQMLGCCTLDQLKYFCKHTRNHRTGAKDRVLYLAYLGLCRQLDPTGPYSI